MIEYRRFRSEEKRDPMARVWVEHGRRPVTSATVVGRIYAEFSVSVDENDVSHDWFNVAQERRAALNLHAFTGLAPSRTDDGRRNSAVDLSLHGPGRTVVAEVTSNAASRDEKAFDRSERLVRQIDALYDGACHWVLHFGKGYAPPTNARRATVFAQAVATDLRRLEQLGEDLVQVPTAPWLRARRIEDGRGLVEGVSWDSRVPTRNRSYVEELRTFLDSPLIRSKRAKLVADGALLDAHERHLYLYATPMGVNAHVFPHGPWVLAGDSLELPDGIDVLWIDTRGRFTYRYSDRDGVEMYPN